MTPEHEDRHAFAHDAKRKVREHYGQFAERAMASTADADRLVAEEKGDLALYLPEETAGLPTEALAASAGCGNPIALASLEAGETVVDFGSGGGIDCFIAARAVGAEGKVIGIDMTERMVALARRNAIKARLDNVEFHLSEMESTPLPDECADVVISNCVICLAPDKTAVFAETYRILRRGGRLFVSDIVALEPRADAAHAVNSETSACFCIGTIDLKSSYLAALRSVGFTGVEVLAAIPYQEKGIAQRLESITVVARKIVNARVGR